jgi:hypothetical protein
MARIHDVVREAATMLGKSNTMISIITFRDESVSYGEYLPPQYRISREKMEKQGIALLKRRSREDMGTVRQTSSARLRNAKIPQPKQTAQKHEVLTVLALAIPAGYDWKALKPFFLICSIWRSRSPCYRTRNCIKQPLRSERRQESFRHSRWTLHGFRSFRKQEDSSDQRSYQFKKSNTPCFIDNLLNSRIPSEHCTASL